MVAKTLAIKGMWVYEAQREYANGNLVIGAPVELRREPNNPFDPNAVEIVLHKTGSMLGHIPREEAKYISELLLQGGTISARICFLGTTTYKGKAEIVGSIEIKMDSEDGNICASQRPLLPPLSRSGCAVPICVSLAISLVLAYFIFW